MTEDVRVVAFCCQSSAWLVANSAIKEGLVLPDDVRLVPIPCTERVNRGLIMNAIGPKTKAILILGCANGKCKNLYGNEKVMVRAAEIKNSLHRQGYNIEIETHKIDMGDYLLMKQLLSK